MYADDLLPDDLYDDGRRRRGPDRRESPGTEPHALSVGVHHAELRIERRVPVREILDEPRRAGDLGPVDQVGVADPARLTAGRAGDQRASARDVVAHEVL